MFDGDGAPVGALADGDGVEDGAADGWDDGDAVPDGDGAGVVAGWGRAGSVRRGGLKCGLGATRSANNATTAATTAPAPATAVAPPTRARPSRRHSD